MRSDEQITFSVAGWDQHDKPFPCEGATWVATGGKISDKGMYEADAPGNFTVKAVVGSAEGTSIVTVLSKDAEPEAESMTKGVRWRRRIASSEVEHVLPQGTDQVVGSAGAAAGS